MLIRFWKVFQQRFGRCNTIVDHACRVISLYFENPIGGLHYDLPIFFANIKIAFRRNFETGIVVIVNVANDRNVEK